MDHPGFIVKEKFHIVDKPKERGGEFGMEVPVPCRRNLRTFH